MIVSRDKLQKSLSGVSMPRALTWLKSEMIQIICLIILAGIIRLAFLFNYNNIVGDAAGHVVESLRILEAPGLQRNFVPACSTLYKYFMASFLFFWRDPILAPKVFSLLFGAFLILPFYGTVKILFNQRIAFISSLLLVCYPLHIVQSSTTTSDAVYYFFIFCSFYYFFRFKDVSGKLSYLFLSALFFNIASVLRYESWVFIPCLFILLWKINIKMSLLFLFLLLIAPGTHLWLSQLYFHNAFYSFSHPATMGSESVRSANPFYDPRIYSWLILLWKNSGSGIVLGGLLGIAFAVWLRRGAVLAIFFFVLLFVFSISSSSGHLMLFSRYSILLGIFLIPYAVFFIDTVASFFRMSFLFLLALIFLLSGFSYIFYDHKHTMPDMFSNEASYVDHKAVGEFLKTMAWDRQGLVLVDDDIFMCHIQPIALISGISPNYYVFTNFHEFNHNLNIKEKVTADILNGRFAYLVLHSKGPVQKFLHLDMSQKEISFDHVVLMKVFQQVMSDGERYSVYRVSSDRNYKDNREHVGD